VYDSLSPLNIVDRSFAYVMFASAIFAVVTFASSILTVVTTFDAKTAALSTAPALRVPSWSSEATSPSARSLAHAAVGVACTMSPTALPASVPPVTVKLVIVFPLTIPLKSICDPATIAP